MSQLLHSNYHFDNKYSIWTPKDYIGIPYNDGDEVEERIALIINKTKDLSVLSNELRPHCTDWPSLYHLSGTRANILRPFEADLCGDILEIGAGCGAITRYLGECGGNVLALEGTLRRAAIARARTRDLENVTVISDRFEDFSSNKKFDVITLIGVLEYSNLFTSGSNPTLSLLERARSFLKPNGRLIIAIENQIGLKYFAGAPEDHIGVSMYGIEGRYRKDQPQTFGLKHLAGLIMRAGFNSNEFLAPFPDYKLPLSIVTSRGFSSKAFDAAAFACQSVCRDPQIPSITAFSPELVWPTIIDNELGLDLSNSFLIVASPSKSEVLITESTLAWHYTTGRLKELCKSTEFVTTENNKIKVLYTRLDSTAPNPIKGDLLIHYLPAEDKYIQGKVLSQDFIEVVTREGWSIEELCILLRSWLKFIAILSAKHEKIADISDPASLIPGNLFDCIPQNIIKSNDGTLQIIDTEWILNEKIDVGYLTFRALWSLFHSLKKFGRQENIDIKNFYDLIICTANHMDWKISNEDIKNWVNFESKIQLKVSGQPIAFSNVVDLLKNKTLQISNLSQAIIDRENESNSLGEIISERNVQINTLRQVVTDRDAKIISLNQSASEQDVKISNLNNSVTERNGQIANLTNAVTERDGQISNLINAVSERDEKISILINVVTERDGQISNLSSAINVRDMKINDLEQILSDYKSKLQPTFEIIETFKRSFSWRITAPLRYTYDLLTTKAKHKIPKYKTTSPTENLLYKIFHLVPVSGYQQERLRGFLFNNFPFIFQNYLAYHLWQNRQTSLVSATASKITKAAEKNTHLKEIVLLTSDQPVVSIIIPIYGQIEYTLRCLKSIAINNPFTPFEVIVVDDKSPDDSLLKLQQVQGITLLTNEINSGFIRTCNFGASQAKGEYVYFLNNDTEVTAGWLDALLRTFHDFPGTGFVGSKLIYPDGRLQEAGGIIWQDGSAWNFGRFQDPQLPVYNYAREVDYCSGASIMVPKALFDELGGFDEHYLPAYCEDSDLALQIRDKGYRVIYQPMSTVIHFEGITSGTDTNQGAKAYQIENSKKLFERWQGRLITYQKPSTDVDSAKDRRASRRVLVLDHCTPTPDQDAGSVTAFNLMLLLREMDFQVTFIPEDNFLYMPEYTTALQRVGIEVLYSPYSTSVEQHLQDYGVRYDLAFLFRPGVIERHLKTVRKHCQKAKILFETADLHHLRMIREADLNADVTLRLAADKMKEVELAAMKSVDATIIRSTTEFELLRPLLPEAKLYTFPLILDLKGTNSSFEERSDIVFIGGYQHTPNVDAVKYFVEEVMPLLRKELPGIRFYAVGSKPPAEIQALATSDVIVTGFIEDLNQLLSKMRVSVAPLRYGAGIKGKIGTAMAVGLPVVATSLAAEGMSLTDEKNILVADGPEALTNSIAKIYNDKSLWCSISQNGIEFADKNWGAETAWETLASILRDLGFKTFRKRDRELNLYTNSPININSKNISNTKQDLEKKSVNSDNEYQIKVAQELAIYEKQINVHDLPDIYHYWSNKYLAPLFRDAGFDSIVEFFSSNLQTAAKRTQARTANFVSIGSGNCDLEISIAIKLIESGLDDFILECLEINPVMLERGKEIAKEKGVFRKMCFVEADFNTWKPTKNYDGVMANQSLHHVMELEHLFNQVKNALHNNGSFVISDMIGRNGHQRWPEALEIVNKFWKELPESKKFNVLLNRFEKEYDNWDCSKEGFEGIRAQDILPLLNQRFECEKFIGFANVIDIFIDRCFGHNFNRDSDSDRDLIDRVHAEDELGFSNGTLTPTHMVGVFVKILQSEPYYSRGITPAFAIRNS